MRTVTVPGADADLPRKCTVMNDEGELPTCTQTVDGEWVVTYPEGDSMGGGVPGWFVGLFVVTLLAGFLVTLYKVGMARTMARRSGMDPDEATAMTLLTEHGLETAYLASNLRPEPQGVDEQQSAPVPTASTADRLRELDNLRAEGLVTEEEYAERRREIIDSV